MSVSVVMFYILAVFILITAFLSVTTSKIFRSAIWLLFSLTGVAGLYFWLQMEFIAAVQVIVYVGGIVVLIIFSIFLTRQSGEDMTKAAPRRAIFSALAAGGGFGLTWWIIRGYGFRAAPVAAGQAVLREIGNQPSFQAVPAATASTPVEPSVTNIGMQLLSTTEYGYVLPFEVASLLLLAAMIGCIVIAMRIPPGPQITPGTPAPREPGATKTKTAGK